MPVDLEGGVASNPDSTDWWKSSFVSLFFSHHAAHLFMRSLVVLAVIARSVKRVNAVYRVIRRDAGIGKASSQGWEAAFLGLLLIRRGFNSVGDRHTDFLPQL
jgi:hypothetical protein